MSRRGMMGDAGIARSWTANQGRLTADPSSAVAPIAEFIRRFLIHVLPSGFHRIRHYGLFANGGRAENLARARQLLAMPTPDRELGDGQTADPDEPPISVLACSCCGGRMIVIETFDPGAPRAHHQRSRSGSTAYDHRPDATLFAAADGPRPATIPLCPIGNRPSQHGANRCPETLPRP